MAKRKAPPCAVCPDVPGMGWKEKEVTHCKGCHFTWPLARTRWQHCARCHETFGGDEAATRHLGRNGACRKPGSVLHRDTGAPILVKNEQGVWTRAFGADAIRKRVTP